jgi:hypothetical protein
MMEQLGQLEDLCQQRKIDLQQEQQEHKQQHVVFGGEYWK